MYKKILICGDKNQFIPFDYNQSVSDALSSIGLNSGNNVFGFALQKMLLSPNIETEMKTISWVMEHTDEINEKYDAVVYSPANILGIHEKEKRLPKWTKCLEKIKVPFTFVGVGAQGGLDYSLDFVDAFKKEGYNFIKAILNTGGNLGLRGYFTAEVVKKLGFSEQDFSVLGCPSLFMNGPDLKIEKKDIHNQLIPIFNGNKFWFHSEYHHLFKDYPESIFICQDLFYPLLYDVSSFKKNQAYSFQGNLFYEMFKDDRIRLYCDYLAWSKELKNSAFNFCCGARIHGNIVSLLNGIPSMVDAIDSRTRELAEFFEIPYMSIENPNIDLLNIYNNLSFSDFNKNFKNKFNNFKSFMNKAGLPCLEDTAYINTYIEQLPAPSNPEMTSKKSILELSKKYRSISYHKKSKLYKFLHFYWLRGKK